MSVSFGHSSKAVGERRGNLYHRFQGVHMSDLGLTVCPLLNQAHFYEEEVG